MFKPFSFLVLLSLLINTVQSQNVASTLDKNIDWHDNIDPIRPVSLFFPFTKRYINNVLCPVIHESFPTSGRSNVEFTDLVYEDLGGFQQFKSSELTEISDQLIFSVYHTLEGNQAHTGYYLCPFKKEGSRVLRLKSFKVKLTDGPAFSSSVNNNSIKRAAANSVLASGSWLKYSVTADGLYKITAADLANAGWDINTIDPKTIKLYGHHGGMLSEVNAIARPDDIPENAITVIGENDGKLDGSDYILFYAQSPNKWVYNSVRYVHETNIYSDKSYYFVTFGGNNGKRISQNSDGQSLTPDASYNWFDDMQLHETESENICNEGRVVLGEKFDQKLIHSFNHTLKDFTNNKNFRFYYACGSLAPVNSSMQFRVNNVTLNSFNMIATTEPKETCYSYVAGLYSEVSPTTSDVQVSFLYNQPNSSSKAWLDYYEIHFTRSLKYSESFMSFRNIASALQTNVEYRLSSLPSTALVWDITDPLNVKTQSVFSDGSDYVFRTATGGKIRQYALTDGNYKSATLEGPVQNQNLHASGILQFIIVTHPDFLEASNKLAEWHRTRDALDVKVVTPQQIYNEFSSGSQDISALRDYFKHVYYQNTNPVNQLRYVMFMGDASFDYKDKIANNTNFVPVYESDYKLNIPRNQYGFYCSDDFFGFLDSTDGAWENHQKLEVVISRLPVVNAQEAMAMVDKMIHYKTPTSLGEWRNFVTFCADDADEDWETEFVDQFESIYHLLDSNFSNVNVRKVYLDAFKQVNLSGSQRYPEAQQAVKKEFEQGTLVFNYIGHGGEEYLSTEKVIDIPLITSMQNMNSLPAFFTATCEFSRFDDAKRKSAGEYVITNPNGGAVAMFTTTRVVTSFNNYLMTYYFWQNCVFAKARGDWPTVGDVYKKMKNRISQSDNDRRFSVFADPALVLNYPEYTVKIDSILQADNSDTVRALSKVTFIGHIEDLNGAKMNSFNGNVFPIVYDKPSKFATLSNDLPNSKLPFELYSNILYKGQSSVTNGDYRFTFVVPKDINYTYGYGRISMYADNQNIDASGNYRDFILGGASSSAAVDVKGPELELFIDDYSFVSGGITDQTPLLLAKVFDENGINTSGMGIGRDIIATIDKGTPNEKRYNLNAFYISKLNSFTTGDIKYQLEGLSEGRHTYTLKVWDVYNNSAEATIEFVVQNNADLKLDHVLNYPNPFISNTSFFFDHNHAGENLKVVINIFTISGKVIKTIVADIENAPGHVSEISWNGKDEADDKPARGVYIYRLTVTTEDGKTAEKIEKLVILN